MTLTILSRICEPIFNHPILKHVLYPDDIINGVVYACSVEDAKKVIPEIPADIQVDGVLGVKKSIGNLENTLRIT